MNIVTEELQTNRHYLIIDSPIEFEIVVNTGSDIVKRMPGCWQIDCYHLLPERFQKQYPAYNLRLRYDKDLLPVGKEISISVTDIDLGMSIVGTDGQNVMVRNFPEFYKVENNTDSSDNKIPVDVDIKNFSDMPSVVLPENYKVTNELDGSNNKVPLEVEVKNGFFFSNVNFIDYDDFKNFLRNQCYNIDDESGSQRYCIPLNNLILCNIKYLNPDLPNPTQYLVLANNNIYFTVDIETTSQTVRPGGKLINLAFTFNSDWIEITFVDLNDYVNFLEIPSNMLEDFYIRLTK